MVISGELWKTRLLSLRTQRSNLKIPVITKRLPRRFASRNDLGGIFQSSYMEVGGGS